MKATLPEILATLDYDSQSSAPSPGVRDDWPHIAYTVTVTRRGAIVWTGPYHLGVGHVKIPKKPSPVDVAGLTADERSICYALAARPFAKPADKALHASFAAKLAARQKVMPGIATVMHSLLSDGAAYFDHASFEDFCAEVGYDNDSRKAEGIYNTCLETGRQLSRAIPAGELTCLRESAQDF